VTVKSNTIEKPLAEKLGKNRPQAGEADGTVCPTAESKTLGSVAQAVSPAIRDFFTPSRGAVLGKRAKIRRGFTLLEMMVATTIMGVAVVGLLSGISGSVHNAARLRDYDRVAQLAREQMNELLADYNMPRNVEQNNQFDPAITGGLEAGWRSQLTTFEKPPSLAGQLALDRIQLDVWWNSGGKRRTIYLESFRKRFVTPQEFQ